MIAQIKMILGFTTNEYDLFIAIFCIWILAFFLFSLFNIVNSLLKKVGGW